jgi:long-chain acyl-CoA synthetase
MVVGDQRPFIACLITLDTEMLPTWLANNGRPALDLADAITDEAVVAEIGRAIDDANTLVSRAESIREFRILDSDFTEASGHLTPKLSIKRHAVMKDYAEQIEAIYG